MLNPCWAYVEVEAMLVRVRLLFVQRLAQLIIIKTGPSTTSTTATRLRCAKHVPRYGQHYGFTSLKAQTESFLPRHRDCPPMPPPMPQPSVKMPGLTCARHAPNPRNLSIECTDGVSY